MSAVFLVTIAVGLVSALVGALMVGVFISGTMVQSSDKDPRLGCVGLIWLVTGMVIIQAAVGLYYEPEVEVRSGIEGQQLIASADGKGLSKLTEEDQ